MQVTTSAPTSSQFPAGLPGLFQRVADTRLAEGIVPWVARASDALGDLGNEDSLLRGKGLGHPLHPALTDLPLGCWTSATILDVIGFKASRPAATTLIAVGLVAAAPTAAAGLADFRATSGNDRRVASIHAVGNSAALACYVASLQSRIRGRHYRGVVAALAGATLSAAAGYLGGHLVFGNDDASEG